MKTELEKRDVLRLSNEESNMITRDCLRIAMVKLMGKKEFDKISITEITKFAGVSRTAFYRNYETKDALVEDICQNLFSSLKASICGERYLKDRREWYTVFFSTIKENRDYFQIYLDARLHFGELDILESIFPSSSVLEHYSRSAKTGAFMSILTEWFSSGMKESPEEMGKICEQLVYKKFL